MSTAKSSLLCLMFSGPRSATSCGKGTRQRRWRQDEAEAVAADMQARDFTTISSLGLLPEALKIAFAHDRAVDDCLYVALAVQSRADLITADERLANALAARFPVKWLGAF